jgi:hypothetical protein
MMMRTRPKPLIAAVVVIYVLVVAGATADAVRRDGHEWKVTLQPDLGEKLVGALQLTASDVLPGPTRVWVENPIFAPNGDGSWDMIVVYQENYMGAKQAVIHDFGAGRTHVQALCTGDETSRLTRLAYTFHLRPHYWAAGKLFVDVGPPSKGVTVLAYDPAENGFVHIERPFGRSVSRGAMALGDDGMVYGIGWASDKSCLVAFRIDPETCEAERYAGFGPSNENWTELYIDCVMDGAWLYAGIGQSPWYLVAYNFTTHEGRVLARTKEIKADRIRLTARKGGATGAIEDAVRVEGIDEPMTSEPLDFWISDGRLHKRMGDALPWSEQDRPLRERQYEWDHNCWYMGAQAHWGQFVPEPGPPEIDEETLRPDSEGRVRLAYRCQGEDRNRTLPFKVRRYPGKVRRMMAIDERRIFAADEGYGQVVMFDLETNAVQRIGDMADLSPYSMTLREMRLYLCGYPSSRLYEFDLTRPFTLEPDGEANGPGSPSEMNPALVAVLAEYSDTHSPFAGAAVAADGRVYAAGSTYGRRRDGGGMGWYDPKTKQAGGIWKPFTPYRVFWMTTATRGRYILLSTKSTEGIGKLFCWDTKKQKLIYDLAPPGEQTPGPLAEVLPGLVIGYTKCDGQTAGRLYGLRAESGEVLWTKDVPEPPITAVSRVRRHAYSFSTGPDGHIWAFIGKTLVRIRPADAHVEIVGSLPAGVSVGQLAFANGRVYMAGGASLMVLGGVPVLHTRDTQGAETRERVRAQTAPVTLAR